MFPFSSLSFIIHNVVSLSVEVDHSSPQRVIIVALFHFPSQYDENTAVACSLQYLTSLSFPLQCFDFISLFSSNVVGLDWNGIHLFDTKLAKVHNAIHI